MSERTIHQAFIEAYADMSNPKKNAANPAFRSKYANLEELLAQTRPILAAVELALVQEPVSEDGSIGVHSYLIHTSGETLDFGYYTVPLAKHDAQGAGSALTYTRRYAIAAIFGLAQEDDDGNAASKPQARQEPKSQHKPEPKPEPKPESKPLPKDDPDVAAWDSIVAMADLGGHKKALFEALGKPASTEDAFAKFKAMGTHARQALEAIALGTVKEAAE